MKPAYLALGVVAIVLLGAAATYEYSKGFGSGTISIGLTDSPVQNVTHIYVTISNIKLQGEGNSSFSYQSGQVQFDLLSLLNVTRFFGNVTIPAGNYTMIRFTVVSAQATIGGSSVTLNVPSGEIKIPVDLQVKAGHTTTVVLEVTQDMTNLSVSGNLRPVVTVKSVSTSP